MATYSIGLQDRLEHVQHFMKWASDHLQTAVSLDKAPNRQFLPEQELKQYFTENDNERLFNLVSILCPSPEHHPHQIVGDIVGNEYMIVFATLLHIGEGHHIEHFTKYDTLKDARMPFVGAVKPDEFPFSSQGDIYNRFQKCQWMFLAARIESRSKHIEPERILPILDQSPLGFGGNGQTYRIEIHPEYNQLRAIQGSPYSPVHNNRLVLKTYHEDEREAYDNETRAFKHLRNQIYTRVKSFIYYHGSFERANEDGSKTFSIILEYADGGDLEKMFQEAAPPQTPREIACFWVNLLEVVQALDALAHAREDSTRDQYLNGWHQDIIPQNILLASNGRPVHESKFKIADLGLAHFRPHDGHKSVAIDQHGTRTFGAPECYRDDVFTRSAPRNISPSVDVWSLGAVLSEAITWVVGGCELLNNYRRVRRAANQSIPNHRDIQSFHDSFGNVQPCVTDWHKNEIPPRIKRGDEITHSVLELVDVHMLVADGCRAHMGSIYHQWKKTKPYAESVAQESTTGVIPPPTSSSSRHKPRPSLPRHGPRTYQPESPVEQTTEVEEDEEPPEWPRKEADAWLQKRLGSNNIERVPDHSIAQELVGRDHVFMIDNSYTMRAHWKEVKDLVLLLSEILFSLRADDKIDVGLVSWTDTDGKPKEGKCCMAKSRDLRDFVERRLPPETHTRRLNVGRALEDYLGSYQDRIRRKGLLSKISRGRKPLSLYVLTDGLYQKDSDLKSSIRQMVSQLEALGKKKNDVGIQFIQLGNHSKGTKRLTELDTFGREERLWSDIADTEPATGNVWKMLLGAINDTFDNDKQIRGTDRPSSDSHTDGERISSGSQGETLPGPSMFADRTNTNATIRPPASSQNRLSALINRKSTFK